MPIDPQVQHAAEWAETFEPSTTNLAQRYWHAQDKMKYAQALQDQQQEALNERLARDKGAQDVFFRSKDLHLKEQAADAVLREREQRMQHAEQLFPETLKLKQAQIGEVGAANRRMIAEEHAQASDTAGFNDYISGMLGNGIKKGTPQWQFGLAEAMSMHPHVRGDHVRAYGEQLFPGQNLTPDEMIQKAHDLRAANPNASVSVNQKGVVSLTDRPVKDTEIPSLEKERVLHAKMLDRAKRIRSKATDEDVKADADADILESQKALADVESRIRSRQSSGQPAPTTGTVTISGGPTNTNETVRLGETAAPAAGTSPATVAAAATAASALPQFKDEASARAAGAKPGDIVVLINPATGKPARARIN